MPDRSTSAIAGALEAGAASSACTEEISVATGFLPAKPGLLQKWGHGIRHNVADVHCAGLVRDGVGGNDA